VARRSGVGHAVATGVGAWFALVTVAAVAVVAGRAVVRRVPLRLVHRVAGIAFAGFAIAAAVAAVA
jgi:putative Ca2+/H+ antiporter (TMEM165/GDT1 family)